MQCDDEQRGRRPADSLRVTGIGRCECSSHALVELRSADGLEELAIKVDMAAARSIAAELAGMPSESASYADIVAVSVEACGGSLAGVQLSLSDGAARTAHLCIESARPARVRIPPGTGLVLAARLDLRVWCREVEPRADVPAIFREAFYERDEPERG